MSCEIILRDIDAIFEGDRVDKIEIITLDSHLFTRHYSLWSEAFYDDRLDKLNVIVSLDGLVGL